MTHSLQQLAAAAAALALSTTFAQAQTVDADLANCRGVNYIISGSNNCTDQWVDYEPGTVTDNLTALDAMGVNGVRVWGSYNVWADATYGGSTYEANLQDLLEKAFEREMLVMLVLFNSYGAQPSAPCPPPEGHTQYVNPCGVELDAEVVGWFKSPAGSAFPLATNPSIDQYLTATFTTVEAALANEPAGQIIYDVWNEPGGKADAEELAWVVGRIKAFGDRRTTVGFKLADDNQALIDELVLQSMDPADLDVISHHPYAIFEEFIVREAANARTVAQVGVMTPRPIIASEAVSHGKGQDYVHVIDWLRGQNEGFMVWEAFASQTMFKNVDGLFYEDQPTATEVKVRDLEGVHRLLGMAVDDGHEPSLRARLKDETENGYIAYKPANYEFTAPEAHDLVMNFADRYANRVYSLHFDEYPTNELGAVIAFYEAMFGTNKRSLERLGELTTQQLDDWDDLLTALETAKTNLSIPGVEDAFEDMSDFLAPEVAPYAASLNTAPDIVYFDASAEAIYQGHTATVELTLSAVVNDADRLSDLASADIYYSLDGSNYTPLQLVIDNGWLGGTFNAPPLMAGQAYYCLLLVDDGEAAPVVQEIVLTSY